MFNPLFHWSDLIEWKQTTDAFNNKKKKKKDIKIPLETTNTTDA